MIIPKMLRVAGLLVCLPAAGCGDLLVVDDPTAVEETDIASPAGAELLRNQALMNLYATTSYGAYETAFLTDEMLAVPSQASIEGGYSVDEHNMDLRWSEPLLESYARFGGYPYAAHQETRVAAGHAVAWYEMHGTEAQGPHLGEMLAVRGYATLALAEQICPGFALHTIEHGVPVYGPPLTTEAAFQEALEDLEAATGYVGDSTRILNFARVARARVLLGLGRFEEAASVASSVPTEFVFNAEFGPFPGAWNQMVPRFFRETSNNVGVSDREGGNGLDFISAADPRLTVTHVGTAFNGTEIYTADKYSTYTDPIIIASGIEARLIEAEAALREGSSAWLAILNDLRQTQVSPALEPLSDPGADEERVDLLFRERAFWMYGTGHRLGDLRRLIAHYGRSPEDLFPTGTHPTGDAYRSLTSVPFFPVGEERAGTGVVGCTAP